MRYFPHVLQPILVIIVFLLRNHNANGLVTAATDLDKPQKCMLERAYKMLGYNCAKLSLKTIPQNLKSNLEIFDLSYNRIRDIDRQSFARYDDIKFLYLQENMIQNLDENSFAHLTDLEAIDLSYNALTTIPVELFSLPILRNLYMQGNALLYLKLDLEKVEKPIKAPLQILNLAECRLKTVPYFGILPDLYYLNVSGNALTDMSPQTFSPMCHVKVIDLNNTRMDQCECKLVTTNLRSKKVNIKNFEYCDSFDDIECHFSANATQESPEYSVCMSINDSKVRNQKATHDWLTIASILVGFLVLFIGVLFVIHLRNARSIKQRMEADRIKKIMVGDSGLREKMIKKSNGAEKRPASDNNV